MHRIQIVNESFHSLISFSFCFLQSRIVSLFEYFFDVFVLVPKDIMSYAALAAIAIQSNQNDQHGGQSIPAFDYCL